MRRILLLTAAALIGCQSNPRPDGSGVSKQPRAAKAPVVESGAARFFARGTTGDAHELELRKLAVDVTTRPGTVRSHLSMEVATRADGQSEAVIRLPVPRGAAVTDAVLWVNDKPMRGAFVERQRATDIYTSIVTRRRDPALVTWDGPGWIAVSIFPLENKRSRRFELEWVEPAAVADGRIQYRVPIVAERERLVGRASVKVDGRRVTGDGGDLIAIASADPHRAFTRRAPGDPFQQVMVREPDAAGAPHFVLVVETSEAMRPYRGRQRAVLDALIEELPDDAKLTMLAADWDVTPIVETADAGAWPDALAKLDAIPSAGALHFERVLREAAARARKTGAGAVLFVGIGVDGFRGDAVAAPVAELRDAKVRMSVVALAGTVVPPALARAAAETGGEAIAAPAFEDSGPLLVDALRPRAAHPALDDRGDGEWHRLRTVTGDSVWIGRALNPKMPAGDETEHADAGSPLAADLASLWDRARLEWHDRDAADEPPRVLTPATSLLVLETDQDYRRFGLDVPQPVAAAPGGHGVRHKGEEGKMGKRTSASREGLYGLRGPRDNPDPLLARRLAEEQARNAGILGLLKQTDEPPSKAPPTIFSRDTALGNDGMDVLGGLIGNQVAESTGIGGIGAVGTGAGGGATGEGSIGLGNLGTIGRGSSGGGNGSGYGRGLGGLGGKRGMAPDVIPGQANVRGSLDPEIIRRIIRRHLNEVRYCYEQELTKQPALGGRILVQFTIAASGQVIASVLQNSTVGNARVESCVVSAVQRWQFPHPLGRGIVIVSYPFVLTPRGGTGPSLSIATDAPPRPVEEALAILAKGADAPTIERIASLLGLRRISNAEALAWMIDRRTGTFETHLLVARLLEQAKRHRDAVRVLSEGAAAVPAAVAAELRALKSDGDADEVVRLASR